MKNSVHYLRCWRKKTPLKPDIVYIGDRLCPKAGHMELIHCGSHVIIYFITEYVGLWLQYIYHNQTIITLLYVATSSMANCLHWIPNTMHACYVYVDDCANGIFTIFVNFYDSYNNVAYSNVGCCQTAYVNLCEILKPAIYPHRLAIGWCMNDGPINTRLIACGMFTCRCHEWYTALIHCHECALWSCVLWSHWLSDGVLSTSPLQKWTCCFPVLYFNVVEGALLNTVSSCSEGWS